MQLTQKFVKLPKIQYAAKVKDSWEGATVLNLNCTVETPWVSFQTSCVKTAPRYRIKISGDGTKPANCLDHSQMIPVCKQGLEHKC